MGKTALYEGMIQLKTVIHLKTESLWLKFAENHQKLFILRDFSQNRVVSFFL